MTNFNNRQSTTYLFIDGGYLWKHYYESVSKWCSCQPDIDFRVVKQAFTAQKSFYYDCLDDIKHKGETQSDFDLRIREQEARFNRIREIIGSHVRLGSLTGTEKNRRQKEVDILLAVDMMNHAVRQNMSRAVLLSGDRDFKPVVESLVQMGLFVEVAGDKKHTSKDLAWAADTYRGISFDDYFQWSVKPVKTKYPIDVQTINAPPHEAEPIKNGSINGLSFTLYKWKGNNNFYIDVPNYYKLGHRLTLQSPYVDRLELYFELQYGAVKWD